MSDTKDMGTQQQDPNSVPPAEGQQEKVFTQADVDRIVGERLARERNKQPDPKELELQQREHDLFIRELVIDKKLPQDIADELKGLDKDKVNSIAEKMAPYLNKANEPILNPTGPTSSTGRGNSGDNALRQAMGLKG